MAKDMARLRNMTPAEMDKEEDELRQAIWKLRLQMTTGQIQDGSKVRHNRKEWARRMTIRREKSLASAAAEAKGDSQ